MSVKTVSVLEHILQYANEIQNTINRFGDNINIFVNDNDYRNSLCMSLLQIGELTTHLSDDFKIAHPEMDWRNIKQLRNICAHRYGTLDYNLIWDIAHTDVLDIKLFCSEQIKQLEAADKKKKTSRNAISL